MSKKQVEAIYPLAPAQQGMLFETLSAPESGIHIEQSTYLLRGRLDIGAFERAWRRIVERHAILRTAFAWKDQEEPLQLVLRQVELSIERHDWRESPTAEQQARLHAYLDADRRRGFKLSKAPLMRLALFQIDEQTYYFTWIHHHILMDGWCRPVIVKEFLTLYQALAGGQDVQLERSRPYRDYITWLRQQDLARAEQFWRRSLQGFKGPTPLGTPCDADGPPAGTERYGQQQTRLPAPATAALRALASRRHLTLNTLIQGLWALLLGRYSGLDDVVLGVTVSGRPAALPGIEATIGLFINTLPLRVQLDPAAPLWDWLAAIQAANLELRHYEHTPGGQIHQWSELPAAAPLYESILVVESYVVDEALLQSAGLTVEPLPAGSNVARTNYALALLAATGAELAFQLVYDRHRLDDGAAALIVRHILALLERIIEDPDPTLAALLAGIPTDQLPAVRRPADGARRDPGTALVAPRTPIERVLAGIWAQVLGVAEVGIDDSFFALGGHSLVATQLLARLRDAFQVELPLRTLFEAPTVAALAATLAQHAGDLALDAAPDDAPPIVPEPEQQHQPFPLTDVQYAYWVGRSPSFELGNVAAYIYFELDTVGLDLARFECAWQQLVARHPMLRAIIRPDGLQQILPQVPPYRIATRDLRGRPPALVEAELAALREQMSHQLFPTDQWPLFAVSATLLDDPFDPSASLRAGTAVPEESRRREGLVEGQGRRLRLHLGIDLLIADAWSLQLLGRELGRLYRDPHTPLPPLALSFRDYVLAEEAQRQGERYQRALAYWRGRLAELPPPPALPLRADPSALRHPRFTRRAARLDPATWATLKARAAALGLTPSSLLLALFAEVLGRWSARERFTLTLTLFNRRPLHPQVNHLVGDFTSLTLLAVEPPPTASFAARARRLQQQLWADLDQRAVGGVQVLRELARHQGRSAAPMPVVFTSTLVQDSTDQASWTLAEDVTITSVYGLTQTPQVWLDQQVAEEGGALLYNWDAVEALFPPALLDAMFDAQSALLQHLAAPTADWHAPLPDLRPHDQLARRRQVHATATPVAPGLLHPPLFAQAAIRPDHPAVITPTRTLSYAELALRAHHYAHQLRAAGARPNTLVAVVMEKGWEQVVAVLAILEAGAAYVPLDPSLPPARFAALLEQAQVSIALTQPELEPRLTWPSCVTRLVIDDTPPPELPALPPVQQPSDLAYVIYTSGSTGLPKGVMIDHLAAHNTILDLNNRFQIGPDDRILGLSALSFDLSVYDIFGVLAAGGTLVLPAPDAHRDPAHWADLAQSAQVTLWNSVPALLEMFATFLAAQPQRWPTSLRLALLSGDWIPLRLPQQVRALAPHLALVSLGGATEAAIWSIYFPIANVEPHWASIPYGKPLDNQQFYVLDAALRECPEWVVGELYIGGAGLAQGYWRDPVRTAERFVPCPWSVVRGQLQPTTDHGQLTTDNRLYKTGDLGRYLPDGNIEFLGRADYQVKVQGYRIELGEVEAALLAHPQVQAAVAAVQGERFGPKRLVAYIVTGDWRLEIGDAGGDNLQSPISNLPQELRDHGPLAKLEWKLRQPGLRRDPEQPRVALGRPAIDEALSQEYLRRRSHRRMSQQPISLARFSAFLSSLLQIDLAESPLPKYRYPSAGSLYPVQAYLAIKPERVEGLAGGTYYYHPSEHSLVLLSAGTTIEREVHDPVNREIFDESAFSIFLIAQMGAIEPLYGELARDFSLIEAGAICQLLMTAAPAQQIGLCPVGALDFAPIRAGFLLDEGHVLLHSLLGGGESPLSVVSGQLQSAENQEPRTKNQEPESVSENGSRFSVLGSVELRAFLKQRLPEYMIPSAFVLLDALPLTPNGKVDRQALPPPEERLDAPVVAPPQTEIERAIAAILQVVLERDQIGIHDNFFDLGGNSLHIVHAYNRLREAFQREFPMVALFEHPTISLLAGYLGDGAERPALQQGLDRGAKRKAAGRQPPRKGPGHE